jgi:chorismate synthase
MAKKSGKRRSQAGRRPAAQTANRQAAPAAASRPASATVAARPTAQPTQAAAAPSTADLANEYRYVLGDLRRVGILAASMFALLVAIALVAQFVIK